MGNSVRLNVTLPQDVADTLKELAGPREQSGFVAKSIRYYAKRLKHQQLVRELREGYIAVSKEGVEITKDFDGALMDGLDD